MSPFPRTTWRPAAFDAERGQWQSTDGLAHGAGRARAEALSLVTWNVWFGERRQHDRAVALIEILRECDADVICLQEVTREFLGLLLAAPWVRREYLVSDETGGSVDPYGVALLSRLPVRSLVCQELPTSMGRGLVLAEVIHGDRPIAVGTVHLESKRHNADVRGEQMAVAVPALRATAPDGVLCGDLNIDETQEDEPRLPPELTDVWPALQGAAPGYTLDTGANTMTAADKGKHKQARYDRVLLHSPSRALRPRAIRMLGTRPVSEKEPDLFPSDHFGLHATFSIS